MTDDEKFVASGGLIAPVRNPYFWSTSPTFTVTYRVRNLLRRWWLRHHGWSTEWTVEYDYVRTRDLIPTFTANRGGISS